MVRVRRRLRPGRDQPPHRADARHGVHEGHEGEAGASIRERSSWQVESRLAPADEFHEHIEDLLALLRPAWAELCALGRTYDAFVTAAIYCHWSQGPLVVVSPTHGAAIAELGAELGFDIYALPEEQPDDAGERLLTRGEIGRLDEMLAPGS